LQSERSERAKKLTEKASRSKATDGLASLVQLLGLITTLVFTSALCIQHMYLGAQRIRYARQEYGESYLESLGVTRRLTPVSLPVGRRDRFGDESALEREKFD